MELTDDQIAQRKRFFGIAGEDESRLAHAQGLLRGHSERIIDRFYEHLLSHEHTRKMLGAPGLLERLKRVQLDYFDRLTSGVYDRDYVENRLKVGLAHERVGLAPQWYLGAYQKYLEIVMELLAEELPEEFLRTIASLAKVISFDMSLALDSYIFRDRERLEEKNRQLVKLDRDKKQLTSMIVHDLQNPLAGIEAFLDYLRSSKQLTDREAEALEEAMARCGDLGNMIQNVLQIGKMEEGRLDLYLENLDLRVVVPKCVSAFRLVAAQEGKTLVADVPEDPVPVRSDQALLERILFNLVRNAVRHTPQGTAISVRVTPGREVVVRDSGPGIPARFHETLFEPYGPARARETGLRTDTGLGLPFCRMAAAALGASLHLQSDADKGTTFALRLPEYQ